MVGTPTELQIALRSHHYADDDPLWVFGITRLSRNRCVCLSGRRAAAEFGQDIAQSVDDSGAAEIIGPDDARDKTGQRGAFGGKRSPFAKYPNRPAHEVTGADVTNEADEVALRGLEQAERWRIALGTFRVAIEADRLKAEHRDDVLAARAEFRASPSFLEHHPIARTLGLYRKAVLRRVSRNSARKVLFSYFHKSLIINRASRRTRTYNQEIKSLLLYH